MVRDRQITPISFQAGLTTLGFKITDEARASADGTSHRIHRLQIISSFCTYCPLLSSMLLQYCRSLDVQSQGLFFYICTGIHCRARAWSCISRE